MIWIAVSVLLVCMTTLVLAWKAAHYVRRALSLFERPQPTWQVTGWQHVADHAIRELKRFAPTEKAESTAPVALAEKAVPLIERWLALKEKELEETHKPPPKPPEVPLLPPDLAALANRESEDWAKEAVAKNLQELGIKCEGDWGKVRSFVMTDPNG